MSRAARSGSRVDTIALAICGALGLILTMLPADRRDLVAGTLRRTVTSPLIALQEQAERSRAAFLARASTTNKLDSLTLRVTQLQATERENERLRRLLGLGRQLAWGFVPAEAIHSQVQNDELIMLNVGSNERVKPRSPIVAPEGLVGVVQTVDPTTSIGLVWPSRDFRVSAMSADGRAFGIVNPRATSGPERWLLELRGVAFRDTLKTGTLIVSSGLGGVFPRGIPIGTVLSELRTSEGWARTYLIRPAVRPQDVTSVMVLLPSRLAQPMPDVWASNERADSAAKRIIAAGDSLARAAASAESAARTHVADSLRRTLTPPGVVPGGAAAESARAGTPRPDSARRDTTRPRPPVPGAGTGAVPGARPPGAGAAAPPAARPPAAAGAASPATRTPTVVTPGAAPRPTATAPATATRPPARPDTQRRPVAGRRDTIRRDTTRPRP